MTNLNSGKFDAFDAILFLLGLVIFG